jgi:phospholipid transport system substrate-binding protein
MLSRRRFAARSAGFVLSACIAFSASAQADDRQLAQARSAGNAVPEASEFVTRLAERAIEGLTQRELPLAERLGRFRQLLNDGFDVPQIGRFVLGRYWRVASEDERREYLRLFEDYIVQNYATRFGEYAGENLRVGNATAAPDSTVTVASELLRPSGPPVKVDWKLAKQDGSFKITDVMVEGVSMSITQRDDFSASIQRSGGKVEGLLAMLRDRVKTAQN